MNEHIIDKMWAHIEKKNHICRVEKNVMISADFRSSGLQSYYIKLLKGFKKKNPEVNSDLKIK